MSQSRKAAHQPGLDRMVEVLKGLAHPTRLGIVRALAMRERTVTELADALEVRQSAVSQHLAPLRLLRLVEVQRREGRSVYALAEPSLRDLLSCLTRCHVH